MDDHWNLLIGWDAHVGAPLRCAGIVFVLGERYRGIGVRLCRWDLQSRPIRFRDLQSRHDTSFICIVRNRMVFCNNMSSAVGAPLRGCPIKCMVSDVGGKFGWVAGICNPSLGRWDLQSQRLGGNPQRGCFLFLAPRYASASALASWGDGWTNDKPLPRFLRCAVGTAQKSGEGGLGRAMRTPGRRVFAPPYPGAVNGKHPRWGFLLTPYYMV